MNVEDEASLQGQIQPNPNLNIVTTTENVNTLLTPLTPCSHNFKNGQNLTNNPVLPSNMECLWYTANISSLTEVASQIVPTTFSFLDMINATTMFVTGEKHYFLDTVSYEVEIAYYLYVFVIPVIFFPQFTRKRDFLYLVCEERPRQSVKHHHSWSGYCRCMRDPDERSQIFLYVWARSQYVSPGLDRTTERWVRRLRRFHRNRVRPEHGLQLRVIRDGGNYAGAVSRSLLATQVVNYRHPA